MKLSRRDLERALHSLTASGQSERLFLIPPSFKGDDACFTTTPTRICGGVYVPAQLVSWPSWPTPQAIADELAVATELQEYQAAIDPPAAPAKEASRRGTREVRHPHPIYTFRCTLVTRGFILFKLER